MDTEGRVGTVLVISSPGRAYTAMKEAWVASWQRQDCSGLRLVFVEGRSSEPCEPVEGAGVMRVDVPECLIPGVLDKTLAAMRLLPVGGWVFRTNLSSHIHIPVLRREMSELVDGGVLGYSPHRDHLSGAGMGLSPGAVGMLLGQETRLDRGLIDDLAISRLLFGAGVPVKWTGRLDLVYPDGLCRLGLPPHYHVRVKTLNREADAAVLHGLAERGIAAALAWFED